MLVHVLLYDAGQDSEGIHSLELSGNTVVLKPAPETVLTAWLLAKACWEEIGRAHV